MEKGRQINLDNIAKMFFRLKKNRKGEFSKGKKYRRGTFKGIKRQRGGSLSNAISKKVLKEFKKAQGFVQNMGRKGAAKINNKIQGGGSFNRGIDRVTDGM